MLIFNVKVMPLFLVVIIAISGCSKRVHVYDEFNLTRTEVQILEKEAEQGSIDASLKLDNYYSYVSHDNSKAIKYKRKIAESGNLNFQYEVAFYLERSSNIKDHKEALYWLNKAADSGEARSQYRLGEKYEAGIDLKQDLPKAKIYYEKAAFSGERNIETMSMEKNFEFYSEGKGCPKNIVKAYAWLLLSATKIHPESMAGKSLKKKMEKMQASLSGEELKDSENEFDSLLKRMSKNDAYEK